MTQYMLSVHMVEGDRSPSTEEIQRIYADVDAVNDEIGRRARGSSAAVCTRRARRPWSSRRAARS